MAKFVELVLTALQFQAEGLLEIADMLADPVETRRKFYHPPAYERQWFRTNWAEAYRNRQQFYRTLSYLKRQGLVTRVRRRGKRSHWFLTKRGKEQARQYERLRSDPFSASSAVFAKPAAGGVTVVAFDVPEKERRKRDWLRICLLEMGFRMLQKSVWVAEGMIDEGFIRALRERELLDKVHIFEVTRQGTIESTIQSRIES